MRAAFLFPILLTAAMAANSPSYERALELYNHTDYSGAIAALKSVPQDAPTLQLMGRSRFMQGDYQGAIDVLEKAAKLEPASSDTALWVGRAYGRRAETAFPLMAVGFATKARDAFEKAVRLNPRNGEAVNDLFEFYLNAPGVLGGGTDRARKLLPLIAQIDPAEVCFANARLAEQKKDYHAAESNLRKAIELAPRQAGRVLDLAKLLWKQGRYEDAERVFGQAETLAPHSPRVDYARAESYIEAKKNLDVARKLLNKYIASTNLTPDDPSREEARRLLKKAEGA
ncbi:MAG TPA: tetratricopeptide repeat protein [Bryobacteraceae bacterium]|nr:tetratricopeptide repeat protein [Bryobacteraceae bacterium]